ncbi:predicted protein [Naegleria gruberi]|uniref:Predicted protein n=1 Tax=Naegleria gruberi TaxID=5762 RepID=D2VHK4_NAEGR|nr:uncharacterized protein NAEGRDRAFT_68357 [Naegleria gruberi]EFC43694.1 predicted protein [Naegleria gruberi]|eukprot:XP_002676438.1 predicted protein [Naegleria gruberi strain NEG-M]
MIAFVLTLFFLLLLIIWLFGSRLLSVLDRSGKVIFHGNLRSSSDQNNNNNNIKLNNNNNNNNNMGDADDERRNYQQQRKRIAITIDDVPWKYSLPKPLKKQGLKLETSIAEICSVMEKLGDCCATLMMIGSYATRNLKHDEELTSKFVEWIDDGLIELANHGMTNSRHASLSREKLREEIVQNETTLNDLLLTRVNAKRVTPLESVLTKFYRPGHGFFTNEMIELVDQLGYRIVLGNIYSFDPQIPVWWLNFVNIVMVSYLYDILKFISFGYFATNDDQAIVILHDRPWTAKLLNYLVPFLKWRGYDIVSLSEIVTKN